MLSLCRGRPRRVWRPPDPGKRRSRAPRRFLAIINTALPSLSLFRPSTFWHRIDRGLPLFVARRVARTLAIRYRHSYRHCYGDPVDEKRRWVFIDWLQNLSMGSTYPFTIFKILVILDFPVVLSVSFHLARHRGARSDQQFSWYLDCHSRPPSGN